MADSIINFGGRKTYLLEQTEEYEDPQQVEVEVLGGGMSYVPFFNHDNTVCGIGQQTVLYVKKLNEPVVQQVLPHQILIY